jgi:hypothetical protein
LLAYATLLWFAIHAYRAREYSYRPLLEDLQQFAASHSDEDTWAIVAQQYQESIQTNNGILNVKTRNFDLALYAFPVETVAFLVAAAVILSAGAPAT